MPRFKILFLFLVLLFSCSGQDLSNFEMTEVEELIKHPVKIREKTSYLDNYIKCEHITGYQTVEKLKIRVYRDKKDGREVKRKVISRIKEKLPVDFVLELNNRGIVVRVHDLHLSEVHNLRATMYYPGDPLCWLEGTTTYLGMRMERGIVAVDPKVYKLRSKFFIPKYGMGYAGDIGGVIKGRRIDLGVMEAEEADRFGIRNVKAYPLKE